MIKTFEDLAKYVASDLHSTLVQEGFKTVSEMMECYWWSASDLKDEVSEIIREAAEAGSDCWMWDDLTHVQIGIEDMPWREFKKLIFEHVRYR